MPSIGVEEAGGGGFVSHVRCGIFERYKYADGGGFAVDGADEVADVGGFYAAAFYLDYDAFCLAGIVVGENLYAVDAFVGAFLAGSPVGLSAQWPCLDQRQGPILELVAVLGGKLFGVVQVFGFADDAVAQAPLLTKEGYGCFSRGGVL